jgi:hypothetical protein
MVDGRSVCLPHAPYQEESGRAYYGKK